MVDSDEGTILAAAPRSADRTVSGWRRRWPNSGFILVIEIRAGAGGNIGLEAVAKAAPDGYTIGGMGQTSNLAINPALYPKMPHDSLRDFARISASQPLVVVVSAKSEVRTLADLVALAKRKPDAVSLGHAGNGTVGHLGGELFGRLQSTRPTTRSANTSSTANHDCKAQGRRLGREQSCINPNAYASLHDPMKLLGLGPADILRKP
jgi:hypothetical protein